MWKNTYTGIIQQLEALKAENPHPGPDNVGRRAFYFLVVEKAMENLELLGPEFNNDWKIEDEN
jgi:hypothetical protein